MRFKKQIVIVCLFTFLFLPFQINVNEIDVEAEPITATYLAYEVITALLLACGVVITDSMTHNAIVDEFYNVLSYEEFMEQQREIQSLSSGSSKTLDLKVDKYIDVVKEVYNLTYGEEVEKPYETLRVNGIAKGSIDITIPFEETYSFYFGGGSLTYGFTGDTNSATKSLPANYYSLVIYRDTGNYINMYLTDGVTKYNKVSIRYNLYKGIDLSCGLSDTYVPDWEQYRDKNKGLSIPSVNGGSICADTDVVKDLDKQFDNTKDYNYPLDNVGSLDVDLEKEIDDGIGDDVIDSPTTGETLWDTLFDFLGKLFAPITNLLKGIWELIKGLFDMLKGLLTSILNLLKSLVQSLIDGIVAIFVPTVALEDVFNLNQNTFFGQIGEVFNFDKLWNLTPKPYEFEVDFPFYDFAEQEQRPFHLEIKFFENKFMKENINLIRNIITYPLLLISIYFVIMHFLPKRDMD